MSLQRREGTQTHKTTITGALRRGIALPTGYFSLSKDSCHIIFSFASPVLNAPSVDF